MNSANPTMIQADNLIAETIQAKTRFMRQIRPWMIITLFLTFFFYRYAMGIPYPLLPFAFLALFSLTYNGFFIVIEKRQFRSAFWPRLFSSIRVGLDMIITALITYYTGAEQSPFIVFFLFGLVGYSIANSSLALSLLMGLWGISLFTAIHLLIYFQIIPGSPISLLSTDPRLVITSATMLFQGIVFDSVMICFLSSLLDTREKTALALKNDYRQSLNELSVKMAETEAANKEMLNREQKMIELKKEISGYLQKLGRAQ